MASCVASHAVTSFQTVQGLSCGSPCTAQNVPASAFLGAGLKKSCMSVTPASSPKPLVVRALEDESKQSKKDKWAGLAYDTSDDQQDITRGKGMVDSLFQGAVGMGTQHAVMSSYEYISTGQRTFQMDNMKDGFYIAPSFMDKLVVHIAKNFMNLPNIKVPLILGVWGGKGQGKSFQCELVFSKLGINPIMMSAGELESGNAGEPAKLIRQRYREAADIIRKKGKMCCLFINDLDAGAGRMGGTTQYTVNNQMVNATLMNIADNPTNVQLPGVYIKEELPRVPIIVTGNDFSTLYAPLIRDGRMEKFYWAPTREDRIGVCKGIFRVDNVPESDVVKIVDTFPGQSIDFFGALRARVYDDEVRKWVGEIGVESMGKMLVNSKAGPPKFERPAMTVEKLLGYGHMLVMEQENVKRVQLADKYLKGAALGDANDDADNRGSYYGGGSAGKAAQVPEATILQKEKKPEENGVFIKEEEEAPVKAAVEEKAAPKEEEKKSSSTEEKQPAIAAATEEKQPERAAEEVTTVKSEKKQPAIGLPEEEGKKPIATQQIAPPAQEIAKPASGPSAGEGKETKKDEERELTRDVVTDALRSLASAIVSIMNR
ncbi:hypothetical protein L7F22_021125 [Adiantum nelumboides]|nr:hypothetical protein [Adiantum nelumboides]